MKERCPVIIPAEKEGQTQINPLIVSFMQQVTIGTYPKQMGLSESDVKRLNNKIRSVGIEFPVGAEWFATQQERRILHAYDEGSNTYKALEDKTGIGYESIKTYISQMRKPREGRRIEGIEIVIEKGKRTVIQH